MSVDVSPELPPQNLYQAADWLRARHPFLDELVRRIAGDSQEWLDEVAGAILDTVDNGAAWVLYGQEHRARPVTTRTRITGGRNLGRRIRPAAARTP